MSFPRINPGERAIVAGRTGSGKSTLGCWLLKQSPGHWVILNPKWTAAYKTLPGVNIIEGIDYKQIEKSIREFRFTVINPKSNQADVTAMDDLIMWLHESYTNIGLCVDELYSLHSNGRPGPGLLGWLTRGREIKQSFLGLTQRPSWISKFLFSESDYIGTMTLLLDEDRDRMFKFTNHSSVLNKIPEHVWYWYTIKVDNMRKLGAVPIK